MITFKLNSDQYQKHSSVNGMHISDCANCFCFATETHTPSYWESQILHHFIKNNKERGYFWVQMEDSDFGRFIAYRSLIGNCINRISDMKIIVHSDEFKAELSAEDKLVERFPYLDHDDAEEILSFLEVNPNNIENNYSVLSTIDYYSDSGVEHYEVGGWKSRAALYGLTNEDLTK